MAQKKYTVGFTVDAGVNVYVIAKSEEEAIAEATRMLEEEIAYENEQPDNSSDDWEAYISYDAVQGNGFICDEEDVDGGFVDEDDDEDSNDEDEEVEESLKATKKSVTEAAGVDWGYFDKFDEALTKYMPRQGEGDTMASQMVTAVAKLIYKWYNDGDVYDNANSGLKGWFNDLSDYANWLYSNISESKNILTKIWDIKNNDEGAYEKLLRDISDALLTDKLLAAYEKKQKVGSIYESHGPFEYMDEEEPEEEEIDDANEGLLNGFEESDGPFSYSGDENDFDKSIAPNTREEMRQEKQNSDEYNYQFDYEEPQGDEEYDFVVAWTNPLGFEEDPEYFANQYEAMKRADALVGTAQEIKVKSVNNYTQEEKIVYHLDGFTVRSESKSFDNYLKVKAIEESLMSEFNKSVNEAKVPDASAELEYVIDDHGIEDIVSKEDFLEALVGLADNMAENARDDEDEWERFIDDYPHLKTHAGRVKYAKELVKDAEEGSHFEDYDGQTKYFTRKKKAATEAKLPKVTKANVRKKGKLVEMKTIKKPAEKLNITQETFDPDEDENFEMAETHDVEEVNTSVYTTDNGVEVSKEDFEDFESVRQGGQFNMITEPMNVMAAAGISREVYRAIINNYSVMLDFFGVSREQFARDEEDEIDEELEGVDEAGPFKMDSYDEAFTYIYKGDK